MLPSDVERRPVADYVKLPEVARRLDVSEKTARRMVKSGKLPAVFIGGAYRVSEEDLAVYLESARVDPGKAPASSQPSFNGLLEEEGRLRYLRGWRAYIYGLARRWEEKPPGSSGEIEPPLEALAVLIEQGVFDPSGREGPSEAQGLVLVLDGLRRLAEIAAMVDTSGEGGDAVTNIQEALERRKRKAS
jgi:excisionase family DNA binding protein